MILANETGSGEAWFVGPWNSGLPASVSFGGHIDRELHVHDQMYEVYLVAQGTARIRVDDAVHVIQAGNIVVIEPGEVHSMLDGSADYRHFVIQTPNAPGDKRIVAPVE